MTLFTSERIQYENTSYGEFVDTYSYLILQILFYFVSILSQT
jgi:hypothetical protein